jgi:hypothetical protein
MRRAAHSYRQLISHFNDTLTRDFEQHPASSSSRHLRVRYLGLILSGFFLPQLFDWISSEILLQPSSRLLIVQSEFMFRHRLHFFQHDLFHFLHPYDHTSLPFPLPAPLSEQLQRSAHHSPTSFPTLSLLDLNRSQQSLRPISNQKPTKLKESSLSPKMTRRLRDFYSGRRYLAEGQQQGRRESISFESILVLLTRLDPIKFVVRPSWEEWDWFK